MQDERTVVILCGSPGAGKTTAARASGLKVFDRDDPQWTSEAQFAAAIAQLAYDPDAHAVVIRAAPTSAARTRWMQHINATHCYLVLEPESECHRRVTIRARHDVRLSHVAITRWFRIHERADNAAIFQGWDATGITLPRVRSRRW